MGAGDLLDVKTVMVMSKKLIVVAVLWLSDWVKWGNIIRNVLYVTQCVTRTYIPTKPPYVRRGAGRVCTKYITLSKPGGSGGGV